MGGIFKFVLFMFLTMAFFIPPEEAKTIKCYTCHWETENDSCYKLIANSTMCEMGFEICVAFTPDKAVKNTGRKGCAHKSHYEKLKMNKCNEVTEDDGVKRNICICDKDNCNLNNPTKPGSKYSSTNSMYLTGWTMFQLLIISFGVIIQYFTQ